MKKVVIVTLTAAAFFVASCNNDAKKADAGKSSSTSEKAAISTMKFEKESYDFGTITEGEKVSHDFKFTNTGNRPLIIFSASASCGCTVPEYPKDPIPPGESAVLKVVFNSAGKSGEQKKIVTISTNADNPTSQVFLEGTVKSKQ